MDKKDKRLMYRILFTEILIIILLNIAGFCRDIFFMIIMGIYLIVTTIIFNITVNLLCYKKILKQWKK
jgi:hypothetical protein